MRNPTRTLVEQRHTCLTQPVGGILAVLITDDSDKLL
jgi:hypothetical protein